MYALTSVPISPSTSPSHSHTLSTFYPIHLSITPHTSMVSNVAVQYESSSSLSCSPLSTQPPWRTIRRYPLMTLCLKMHPTVCLTTTTYRGTFTHLCGTAVVIRSADCSHRVLSLVSSSPWMDHSQPSLNLHQCLVTVN